jgi:hypothetical protein
MSKAEQASNAIGKMLEAIDTWLEADEDDLAGLTTHLDRIWHGRESA